MRNWNYVSTNKERVAQTAMHANYAGIWVGVWTRRACIIRDLNKVDSKEDVDQKLKLRFFLEFCDWHLVIAFFLKRQTNHEARYEKS